jgi:tryptophan 2,3-dioxygenase
MAGNLYYGDYLKLDKLLGAQELESAKSGSAAHDEMLFIIVHQAYELWFKQILWELDAVMRYLSGGRVDERDIAAAVHHLERVAEIQRLLMQQIDVLETMTPLDFLDFRDALMPASGFQSAQWRMIENRLGMRPGDRVRFSDAKYTSRLSDADADRVEQVEEEPSIFDLVQAWLERTPFVDTGMFDFWKAYREAVSDMLDADERAIRENVTLTEEEIAAQLKGQEKTREHFRALFDADLYEAQRRAGDRRLSHAGLKAALLIHLYRSEPILHGPFRLLQILADIDEGFTAWRYRHALMAMRMIGTKIGTGGSSGHKYLREAADRNRVYTDLINLSTFFIPRSALPALPDEVARQLGFQWTG